MFCRSMEEGTIAQCVKFRLTELLASSPILRHIRKVFGTTIRYSRFNVMGVSRSELLGSSALWLRLQSIRNTILNVRYCPVVMFACEALSRLCLIIGILMLCANSSSSTMMTYSLFSNSNNNNNSSDSVMMQRVSDGVQVMLVAHVLYEMGIFESCGAEQNKSIMRFAIEMPIWAHAQAVGLMLAMVWMAALYVSPPSLHHHDVIGEVSLPLAVLPLVIAMFKYALLSKRIGITVYIVMEQIASLW